MVSSTVYKPTVTVITPMIALLLWLCQATAAVRPSSNPLPPEMFRSQTPMFPLEIFGSQNVKPEASKIPWQQVTLQTENDHPRFSTPDFPGDETGGSPFFYCPESNPDEDIFKISKIVLNPNPPRINYIFVFHAHGEFRETINNWDGDPFRVQCTVRNEGRNGLDFTFERDFCKFVSMMELDDRSTGCPPPKGNATIHKFEFVDFGISEGNYSLKIDVKGNGKRVFCVQSWFELTRTEFPEL